MGFNTFPCNPYPISTEELNKGNNDDLNTRVAALESDVSDLNSNKANQITIAPFFNSETAYTAGDLVYYNGLSYRCTNDHEGEWDADDFAATTIAGELDTLKSGLTDVNSKLTSYTKLFETSESGTYRDKFNSMHAIINALSYHDRVASFIDFNGTICRFTNISGTTYKYVGNDWENNMLKSRIVAIDPQYSYINLVGIDTTGTTVDNEDHVENTNKFAVYV